MNRTLSALFLLPCLAAAQQPTLPEAKPQSEQRFAVGKWPEGVVVVGGSTWVAQSGVRSVGQFDVGGVLKKTIGIGRLPVSMAVGPEGTVLVSVHTDGVLKRIDPKSGKASVLAKFPDGPEEMVVDGEHAFVLLWKDNSSLGSSVLRVPLGKGGKVTRSGETGKDAFGLAACEGQVWVALAGGQLVQLDGASLEVKATVEVGGRPMQVACSTGAVFGGGGSRVVRVAGGQVSQTVELSAPVAALGAWDDLLAVATDEGTVWILDPATLAIRHRLQASAPFRAQAMARDGQSLLLTAHNGNEAGLVVRVALPQ
jgi:hypothetical protein